MNRPRPPAKLAVTIALGAVLLFASAAGADAQQPAPATTTPAPTVTAPTSTVPGVQVGPTLPSSPPASGSGQGGDVQVGGSQKTPWWKVWDVGGQISNGIDSWFRGLVTDALNPTLELVGRTVLATPQVAGQERVSEIWLLTLGVSDSLLVLFVLAAAALVMSHETLHTRYALKDALPRIVFAAITANASLSLTGQMIDFANALSAGFLAGGVDPVAASEQMKTFVLTALSGAGIFVILLGLAAAVLAVILLVLYIVRATIVLLLVAAAPLMLLTHVLPQTDGLARLWWRGMTAALGVQVAQSLVLATAVRVFFDSGGHAALGLSVSGSLIDLLVCICLFWILIRIPFWAKDMAFSGKPSVVTQVARSYVLGRTLRGSM
jgi:hypothetical protein